MTDNDRAEAIRAYIAGIERIKKGHAKSSEFDFEMDRIHRRLGSIMKLYKELQANGREDLWEEFRDWAEGLSYER